MIEIKQLEGEGAQSTFEISSPAGETPPLVLKYDASQEAITLDVQFNNDDIKSQVIALLKNEGQIESIIWELADSLKLSDEMRIQLLQTVSDQLNSLAHVHAPEVQRTRHFHSPQEIKRQLTQTLVGHLNVVAQIKSKNKPNVEEQINIPQPEFLSQSELHMKAMLGPRYQPGLDNLRSNVEMMLKDTLKAQKIELSDKEFGHMVDHCEKLIKNEKNAGPDTVFFYHACSSEIAFAYDVYSALYKIFQANPDARAFRANNIYFKDFMNIEQFIKASMDRHGDILDVLGDYHQTALAANWALFGNLGRGNESSMNFFLKNSSYIKMYIEKLLHSILPDGLPGPHVKALIDEFKKRYPETHGVLYQIAVPATVADDIAYLAFPGGGIHPYKRIKKLSIIKKALEDDLAKNDSLAEGYLETMQVRFMAPPHLELKVDKITAHDLAGTPRPDELQGAMPVIQDIATEILLNDDGFLREGTVAERLLNSVAQANRMPTVKAIGWNDIRDAIDENDYPKVLRYVKQAPDFAVDVMVRLCELRAYDACKQIIAFNPSLRTPALIHEVAALNNQGIFIEFMHACFEPGWQHALPEGFVHNLFTLQTTLKSLENDSWIPYIINNVGKNIPFSFVGPLQASEIFNFFEIKDYKKKNHLIRLVGEYFRLPQGHFQCPADLSIRETIKTLFPEQQAGPMLRFSQNDSVNTEITAITAMCHNPEVTDEQLLSFLCNKINNPDLGPTAKKVMYCIEQISKQTKTNVVQQVSRQNL